MGIGKRIKEARESLNLNQAQLASKVNVTPSAITNYEREISHPKEPILYALMKELHVDANYLFQDEMDSMQSKNTITKKQLFLIDSYEALDSYGKMAVDSIIEVESKRIIEQSHESP